jgi:hypothetical protein
MGPYNRAKSLEHLIRAALQSIAVRRARLIRASWQQMAESTI